MNRLVVPLVALFSLLPGIAVVAASLTAAQSLAFPPKGLSLRWYFSLFSNSDFLSALFNSVTLAMATSIVTVIISLLACLAIVRYRLPGTSFIEGLLLSPLAVPHVVIGIAVLQVYIHLGLRADLVTLTIGHLLLTVPFALRILIASLSGLDPQIEKAAASLGATPRTILLTIVLPQIRLGIIGALIAAFVLSFDDVTLTIFLIQPGYTTVPILLFSQAENDPLPTIHAASVILLITSWVGVFAIDRLVGFERAVLGGTMRNS